MYCVLSRVRYTLLLLHIAAIYSSVLSAGENLIVNSGFELGTGGYTLVKFLREETNPELQYEGALVDTANFDTGKQSLRIPNRFAEQVKMFGREVQLKPGAGYSFSISAKSDAEPCVMEIYFISATRKSGWAVHSKKFQIEKGWKRYSFSFNTRSDWKQPFYSLSMVFCRGENAQAGDIWLDSLQLTESSAEIPYAAMPGLEISSRLEQSVICVPEAGGKSSVVTYAANNSDKPIKTTLSLQLTEDFSGNEGDEIVGESLELAKLPLELAPNETKKITSTVKLDKYGAFRLDTLAPSVPDAITIADYCAIIGEYKVKPIELESTFCFGVNFANRGLQVPPLWGDIEKPGIRSGGFGNNDYIKLYAQMGVRLFRDWDYGYPAFFWRDIEPDKGKYNFANATKTYEAAKRNGIEILPPLGGSNFIAKNGESSWPEWLSPLCKKVEKSGDWKLDVLLPPVDLWQNYIRQVAQQFKGKIKYYEIINEPNGFLSPEVYVGYLKSAYQEIKAIDSSAKVVAICSTGDMAAGVEDFVSKCCEQGALQYADAVSFHPYDASTLGSRNPADKQIASLKALLAKHGKPQMPLWNTELYHLSGNGPKVFPHEASWRLLTDLGEGIAQSVSINADALFRNPCAPHFNSPFGWSFSNVNGIFVASSAFARMLEGAKPLHKFKWGGDTVCYVYEKSGKNIAAFWRYGTAKGVKAEFSDYKKLQLYDLYANKLPFVNSTLEISERPFFVTAKSGLSSSAFVEMLKGIKADIDNPLSVGAARLIPENGWRLSVAMHNSSGSDLKCNLGLQGEGISVENVISFTIPAGEDYSPSIPVKIAGSSPEKVMLKVQANGKIWNFPLTIAPPTKKTLAAKKANFVIQKLTGGNASFELGYDEKYLRISVNVKDSMPSGNPNGRDPWEQDCVELFIDAAPGLISMKGAEAYTEKIARIFVMPYAPEGEQLLIKPRGLSKLSEQSIKREIKRINGGYSVQMNIALEALELPDSPEGKCIGFELAVDFADQKKRNTSVSWSSDGNAYKNRLLLGIVKFE